MFAVFTLTTYICTYFIVSLTLFYIVETRNLYCHSFWDGNQSLSRDRERERERHSSETASLISIKETSRLAANGWTTHKFSENTNFFVIGFAVGD